MNNNSDKSTCKKRNTYTKGDSHKPGREVGTAGTPCVIVMMLLFCVEVMIHGGSGGGQTGILDNDKLPPVIFCIS